MKEQLLEHPRAPELYYTMRSDELPNRFGLPGTCWFASSEIPDGGGRPRRPHALRRGLGVPDGSIEVR